MSKDTEETQNEEKIFRRTDNQGIRQLEKGTEKGTDRLFLHKFSVHLTNGF